MKRLMEIAEEKDHFMGPDMERIAELSIQEKILTLSNLTTLTIDIQKILQSWTDFQTSSSSDIPSNRRSLRTKKTDHQTSQPIKIKHKIMTTWTDKKVFVPPCFFGTKKHFVFGGDVGGASRYADLDDSRLS